MTGFSDPADTDNTQPADEPAAGPMAPDEPGMGGDHQAVEPVDPREPEPDVNDGEAPKPMGGDEDIISGQ